MKNAIITGIFAAVAYVGLGFFMEGGDNIGTWLPQRVGYGLAFGLVFGVLMQAKKIAASRIKSDNKTEEPASDEQG